MPGFMDIVGPVISDTFYVENQLAAKDVTITLPEVTPLTADLQAAGTLTMPVWQLLDNMTMTIQDRRRHGAAADDYPAA